MTGANMLIYLKASVAAAFLSGAAWLVCPSSAASALSVADSASPRSLYVQNCATCHGSNGKAQTARGRRLEASDLTSGDVQGMDRARIIRAIINGRPGMPSFRKKLTANQIAQIAGYVHSF